MNNKFEDWMNNKFAPWALTMVFAINFIVFMLIFGQLAFGKWVMKNNLGVVFIKLPSLKYN